MVPNISETCKKAIYEKVYVCIKMFLHGSDDWNFNVLAPIIPWALTNTSILEQYRSSTKTQDRFSEHFWGAAIGGVPPLVFV